jgi:hypothetical protein
MEFAAAEAVDLQSQSLGDIVTEKVSIADIPSHHATERWPVCCMMARSDLPAGISKHDGSARNVDRLPGPRF